MEKINIIKNMENNILLNARKNIYSQNGEDGVIELLIDKLQLSSGSFCEFGAWDGKYLSNTYNLLENKGWSGVYIEGDVNKFEDLTNLKNQYDDRLEIINAYVDHQGSNTLNKLLKTTKLKYDFDLLSIDIDGMDYHIWNAFTEYKPKIVIIEVNSNLRPGDMTVSEIDTENSWIGSSFSAVCDLGIKKGYYPIIHFGNVFLGDKDFLISKNYQLNDNIDSLYNWH